MENEDYRAALGNCACFYEAAKILDKEMNKSVSEPKKLAKMFVSASVNYAFACELALKGILLKYEVGYGRNHKLNELVDLLPNEIKNVFYQALTLRFGVDAETVGQKILEIANVFVEWRYFALNHNALHLDYQFFHMFAELVCQYALKIES